MGRKTKADRLRDVLDELGFTEGKRGEDDEKLRWDVVIEDPVSMLDQWRSKKYLMPLAELGWISMFDGEGSFFENGHHSKVVAYLLRGAGVAAEVSDRWDGETTLVMELRVRDRGVRLTQRPGYRSDYANLGLLLAAVRDGFKLGGVDFTIRTIDTGDQGVCLVTLPRAVEKRLIEEGLFKIEDEPIEGEPERTAC